MNPLTELIKSFSLCVLFFLALGGLRAEVAPALTPLPGAEYKAKDEHGNPQKRQKRVMHYVEVADLVEGSPEWVRRQVILLCRTRDFETMANYVSVGELDAIKRQDPATLAAMVAYLDVDREFGIGDGKLEADRGYIYMIFPSSGGSGMWTGGYEYFLKRDGKWIHVSSYEWRQGKCM